MEWTRRTFFGALVGLPALQRKKATVTPPKPPTDTTADSIVLLSVQDFKNRVTEVIAEVDGNNKAIALAITVNGQEASRVALLSPQAWLMNRSFYREHE